MSIPKTDHTMSPDQAEQTVAECVCAGCYGQLIARYQPKEQASTVACATDDCSTPGFVTRKWVEREKEKNAAQAAEAKEVLAKALPWMKQPRKTEAELLKSLGF